MCLDALGSRGDGGDEGGVSVSERVRVRAKVVSVSVSVSVSECAVETHVDDFERHECIV